MKKRIYTLLLVLSLFLLQGAMDSVYAYSCKADCVCPSGVRQKEKEYCPADGDTCTGSAGTYICPDIDDNEVVDCGSWYVWSQASPPYDCREDEPTSTPTPTPSPTATPSPISVSCSNPQTAGTIIKDEPIVYNADISPQGWTGYLKYQTLGGAQAPTPAAGAWTSVSCENGFPCTFTPNADVGDNVLIAVNVNDGTYVCSWDGTWTGGNPPTASSTCTNTCEAVVAVIEAQPTPTPTSEPGYCAQGASITLPTLEDTAGPITFTVKFQGVEFANIAREEDKTQYVKVTTIKQVGDPGTNLGLKTVASKTFEDVMITATGQVDEKGIAIWQGTFNPEGVIAGDSYSILVKGPKHLQKKFCTDSPTEDIEGGFPYHCREVGSIILATEDNVLTFSDVIVQAGDLPGTRRGQDGIVNAYDVSLVLDMIRNGISTEPADLAIADMDLNGVVNAKDRSYLIETLEEKYGDEE